ncbi:hypothetical protein R1flu_026693 [Riccia fluitans]|uniref:Myb/SANT-like DNA-binding domain-containing protein n=1 Tax=Riccia fluitans TaxID=41844 RepID=A0ABD1XGM8_9MARC
MARLLYLNHPQVRPEMHPKSVSFFLIKVRNRSSSLCRVFCSLRCYSLLYLFCRLGMVLPFWTEGNFVDSQQTADGGIDEFSQPGMCSQMFNFTFPMMRPEIDINEAAPFCQPTENPQMQSIRNSPTQPTSQPSVVNPSFSPRCRDESIRVSSWPPRPRKALNRRRVKGQNMRGRTEVHGNVESPEGNPESPANMHVDEVERDENESEGEEGGVGEVGKGRKWRNWDVVVLLEAKREEALVRSSSAARGIVLHAKERWDLIARKCNSKGVNFDGAQCRGKWNVLVREYRKIVDHNSRSGKEPWESMNLEEQRKADLPMSFEDEHLRILDSFMKDKAAQNPTSIAESSIFSKSNVDDSDESTGKKAQLNGKHKRPVGENTKFIVARMRDSMRELGEVMMRLEADRLLAEK